MFDDNHFNHFKIINWCLFVSLMHRSFQTDEPISLIFLLIESRINREDSYKDGLMNYSAQRSPRIFPTLSDSYSSYEAICLLVHEFKHGRTSPKDASRSRGSKTAVIPEIIDIIGFWPRDELSIFYHQKSKIRKKNDYLLWKILFEFVYMWVKLYLTQCYHSPRCKCR